MRKIIIAGNWKMHKTLKEAKEFASGLKQYIYGLNLDSQKIKVVILPSFTVLQTVKEAIYDCEIELGAQDVFWEEQGAFTGEVSAIMLKDVGVKYVIVGHSERRQYFYETNEMVNKKVKALLKQGLIPIICLGETLEQREKGLTFSVLKEQTEAAFSNIPKELAKCCVIAYEPVWAIGTGRNATSQQAEEAQRYIRELLINSYNEEVGENISILYGGSVKPENVADIISQPNVDGALVGGASLNLEQFLQIIKITKTIKRV